MSTQKVGIVGAGRMGANIGRRLKDVGYPIAAVFDARPESARRSQPSWADKPLRRLQR